MKTYRNLFEQVASAEALFAAFYRARRGKRYRREADRFFGDLEGEVFRLERELREGAYRPGVYSSFYISEPKVRLVSAAPFRDRVVHHAIHAVLEPIFEPRFIFDTYACRRGKGQHRALDRFTYFARRYDWVAKFDVRRFFPSISHPALLQFLGRTVRDERLMELIGRIVESGSRVHPSSVEPEWFPGDTLFTPLEHPRGLPIGNLTSQLFANLYLAPLDEYVKRTLRWPAYLRYMDDLVFFADGREPLNQVRELVSRFVERQRLRLHADKCLIVRTAEGMPYLGFKVYPDHRLLLGRSIARATRRFGQLLTAYSTGAIGVSQVRQSVASWLGHTKHGDTWGLRTRFLEGAAFVRDAGFAASWNRRPHTHV